MALEALSSCYQSLVEDVRAEDWHASTPCAEWCVRDLVNHVSVELLWVPPVFAAEDPVRSARRFAGDVLGKNPPGVFRFALTNAMAALGGHNVLDSTVRLSYGARDGLGYARELMADLAVHWWDLSRAVRSSRSLPQIVISAALTEFRSYGDLAATGMFAPPVPMALGASELDQLVSLAGREPSWRP